MEEDLSVFILHLEMSWCLFLCHWFKLALRQRVKGFSGWGGKGHEWCQAESKGDNHPTNW